MSLTESRKLPEVVPRKSAVGRMCEVGSRVATKMPPLPVNLRHRSPSIFAGGHSLKSAGIIFALARIVIVLSFRAWAKISLAIIERVSVPMVNHRKEFASYNHVHHKHGRLLASSFSGGVEAFIGVTPYGVPIPLRQSRKIFGVNDGVFPLSQRNKAYILVRRLGNGVPNLRLSGHFAPPMQIATQP